MASEVLSRPQDLDPTQWHAGNIRMQFLMSVPYFDNPTSPYLRPAGAMILSSSPLLAVGTLDSSGRPWTTLWGGEKGFISVMNQAMLGVNMVVDRRHDPVIKACRGSTDNGKIFGGGQVISALGIDLETRQRVKLSGKVAGAALNGVEGETTAHGQMVLQVESSLSNCPKYLNAKHIRPTIPLPQPEPSSLPLSPSALSLISKADLFFLTSSASGTHLSTNYRGGPRGFIRIVSSTPSSTQLAYPEYSGNRLYQTLGNLHVTPLTGIVIPDFTTGDALYATCSAEIHVGPAAAALIPRSNLVIVLTLAEALFVRSSLAFRAAAGLGSPSPYNPPVRPLATESAKTISISSAAAAKPLATATLTARTKLTPTVARLAFATDVPVSWKRGQHVVLSFAAELGAGYAHMNDADPASLNDDLVRSFTLTSPAPAPASLPDGQGVKGFELVVRDVGRVTGHLLRVNVRAGMEVGVLGFGGNFAIRLDVERVVGAEDVVGYVAGGVGITPLLGQLAALDGRRVRVWWAVGGRDVAMVRRLVGEWKEVGLPRTSVFVSGAVDPGAQSALDDLEAMGLEIHRRRMESGDFEAASAASVARWYVCAGPQLKKSVQVWLQGQQVISEEFNF